MCVGGSFQAPHPLGQLQPGISLAQLSAAATVGEAQGHEAEAGHMQEFGVSVRRLGVPDPPLSLRSFRYATKREMEGFELGVEGRDRVWHGEEGQRAILGKRRHSRADRQQTGPGDTTNSHTETGGISHSPLLFLFPPVPDAGLGLKAHLLCHTKYSQKEPS